MSRTQKFLTAGVVAIGTGAAIGAAISNVGVGLAIGIGIGLFLTVID